MSTKRKKLFIRSSIILFILSLLLYGFFIEPKTQHLQTKTIHYTTLPATWENIKILYITDTTLGNVYTLDDLKKSVKKINNETPDFIFFAGSLLEFSDTVLVDEAAVIAELNNLRAPMGKFAFLPDITLAPNLANVQNIFAQTDFQVLENGQQFIYPQTLSPINLIAVNNAATPEQRAALLSSAPETFAILVDQTPDTFATIATDHPQIGLTLSYGTYGGNLGIPYLNRLLAETEFPRGFHTDGEQQLLVSNGIGTQKGFPFRMMNRPKIYSITLQRKNS